jgi:trigger factor
MENGRPQAEQSVKADLALRAIALAEGLDATEDDVEIEFARMALQFGQKEREIRRAYEQNDAVPDLMAQIRKSKAMDWLLHHVEMVDPEGTVIDRDLVLGHDDHDDHDHDDHDGDARDGDEPDDDVAGDEALAADTNTDTEES